MTSYDSDNSAFKLIEFISLNILKIYQRWDKKVRQV